MPPPRGWSTLYLSADVQTDKGFLLGCRELDDDSMDLEGVDVGFHGRSFSSAVVCAFCPRGAVWHR